MRLNQYRFRIILLSAVLFVFSYSFSDDANSSHKEASQHSSQEATDTTEPQSALEQLAHDLIDIMIETSTPTAGIAIVSRESDIWVGGLGYADLTTKERVDANTMFRIGSISKMFVGLSALKMEEDGLMKLSDPISDHVSDIPFENPWAPVEPITVAHLLEHTSGFDDLHFNEIALEDPSISLRDALLFNPNSRKSRWRPGTYGSYSNANPAMVAYAIEQITEMPFEDYVRANFFKPLGMTNTSYHKTPTVEKLLPNGYRGKMYSDIILRPSGSINSSAAEMANLLRLLINRGEFEGQRLLGKASIERMETTKTSLAAKAGDAMGFGVTNIKSSRDGYIWQGHNGSIYGYKSTLSYLPEHGLGFVIMVNAGGKGIRAMSNRIARYLTDSLDHPPAFYEQMELGVDELKQYEGIYQVAATRQQIVFPIARLMPVFVNAREGILETSIPFIYQSSLYPKTKNVFYVNDQKVANTSFFQDQEGRWSFQKNGKGGFRKTNAWLFWAQLVGALFCALMAGISILSLIVVVGGKLAGNFKDMTHLHTHLMPSYAMLAFVTSFLILIAAQSLYNSPLEVLGKPTVVGVLNFMLRWGYLILVASSCWLAAQAFFLKVEMSRVSRYYLILSNASAVTISVYTLYWCTWLPIWMY